MEFQTDKEKIFSEIRQSIGFLLREWAEGDVEFEISDFFRNKLVSEILQNFDNVISQEEYVETVLREVLAFQNGNSGKNNAGWQEVEQLVKQLKERPRKNTAKSFINRIYPASREIQIDGSSFLASYYRIIEEQRVDSLTPDNFNSLTEEALQKQSALQTVNQGKTSKPRVIWTIASGKGGTGKSILAANIAIGMAILGYRVVIIDADLGVPNLHNHLHVKRPLNSLDDFLSRRVNRLSNVIVRTPLDNLHFISGASNFIAAANIPYTKKFQLIRHITGIPADIILVDIGSGTSLNIIDLFNISNRGIIVSNPEPNAVQDAYFLLKNVVYRRIRKYCTENEEFGAVFKKYLESDNEGKIDIPGLQLFLNTQPESVRSSFNQFLQSFRPRMIMNKVYPFSQKREGNRLVELVRTFMNVEIEYLGNIPFDTQVIKSAHTGAPFICQFPKEKFTRNLYLILKSLDISDLLYQKTYSYRTFRKRAANLRDGWVQM